MFRWAPYTFVRILFFLITGILLGIYSPDIISLRIAWWAIVGVAIAYLALFIFWHFIFFYKYNPGLVGLCGIFLSGYMLAAQHDERSHIDHIQNVTDTIRYYRAVVTGYSEERENAWRVEALISSVWTGKWIPTGGKVMLYFAKQDFQNPYLYGDVLLIKGKPKTVPGPRNPGQFDYKKYLGYKNIYHQHYLRKDDQIFITHKDPSIIVGWAMRCRRWSDRQLERLVSGEREQGIASALVLGITDGLDPGLLGAYAATGSMHVLAVSGLHIAIIYLLVVWLFKPLTKSKAGPWILAIVSLIVLWGYAFLTGLSPSVLRAVTMFSFIAVAKPARQFTNIYNILAVSAFFLLVHDPYLIMSVGFQLSYMAVFGIVYLQPRIYAIFKPANYLVDETWKLTAVSIAAQIGTLPFAFLYFHQFPNYFLITNLLVVPISFVVLIAGIVAIVLGTVPLLSVVTGWVLTWSIRIMNAIIFFVEDLPYALINDIRFDVFACAVMSLTIILLSLLFDRKQFKWLLYAFTCCTILTLKQWTIDNNTVMKDRLIVYAIPGHSAIDIMKNGQTQFISDSTVMADVGLRQFYVNPVRLHFGATHPSASTLLRRDVAWGQIIIWRGKVIGLINRKVNSVDAYGFEYLIISNNAVSDLSKLKTSPSAKIILDGSNSYFYAERMLQQAKTSECILHSVHHDGAYIATI